MGCSRVWSPTTLQWSTRISLCRGCFSPMAYFTIDTGWNWQGEMVCTSRHQGPIVLQNGLFFYEGKLLSWNCCKQLWPWQCGWDLLSTAMLVEIMYRSCETHSVCDCKCECVFSMILHQPDKCLTGHKHLLIQSPFCYDGQCHSFFVSKHLNLCIEILGTSCSVGWCAYWWRWGVQKLWAWRFWWWSF